MAQSLLSGSLSVLLYADDTVLVGRDERHLQQLLDSIARAGANMGMELHWDKFQLLQIKCDLRITDPSGKLIAPATQMMYLGATLYDSGNIKGGVGQEAGRRMGGIPEVYAGMEAYVNQFEA